MGRKKFEFSDEQIQYIRDNWGKESATSMTKKFGCCWYAVVNKALELGLEKPKSKEDSRWTKEQDDILKENAHLSAEEIATLLGRTTQAVYLRAHKIGVKLKYQWTKEEESLLEEIWGSYAIETIAKKLNRTVDSIRLKAIRLHLGPAFESNGQYLKISDIEMALNVNGSKIRQTWIKNGLKTHRVKISQKYSIIGIKIEDLFRFLEQHQNAFDARYLEEGILGPEPEWLIQKRKMDFLKPPQINFRPWTKNEVKLLTHLLSKGKSQKEIGKILNRSCKAVNSKVFELNLCFPNFWTDEEIALLQQNYENGFFKSYHELSEELGRSENAILHKCRSLKISHKDR